MIAAIEQAMIDALQAVSNAGALGYTLFASSYAGPVTTPSGVAEAALRFPAAVVLYAGETIEPVGVSAWRASARFALFAIVQNRRNEKASRHGADGRPGAYQVIEDCRALLAGRTFGFAIDPLQPIDVRSTYQEQDLSIYRLEFATAYEFEALTEAGADLATLALVHVDWDVPGHIARPATIPAADGGADLQSHIVIEQETP